MEEIRSGSAVNAGYSLPEQGRYLSFSGMAYVIRDRIRMEMLWNDSYLTWFPLGLKDPDLVLLRVDIGEVEVWDPANQFNGVSIKIS